jgi:hypothetical protein
MKVVFSFVAALALAGGLSLSAVEDASARCGGPSCQGAILVPAPNPIPLRRLVVVPGPAVVPPCAAEGACGTPFFYAPTRFYAYWKQPSYTACYGAPGNCYWRRDCWYDSFGRRFCN